MNIFSRRVDVGSHGIIFAGAQKNMGPAGVTVVLIREDLLDRTPDSVPTMLRYKTHADKGSMFNTPPCFAIYCVGQVMKWLKELGGIDAIEEVNDRKAHDGDPDECRDQETNTFEQIFQHNPPMVLTDISADAREHTTSPDYT